MIVRTARRDEHPWIVSRAKIEPSWGLSVIEAVDSDGKIAGQIAAQDWRPNSVTLHIAIDAPQCMRQLARRTAEWIFIERGLGVALGFIAATNERSLRLAKGMGFRELFRVRDGLAEGIDLVALEMRRENCRWLKG